MPTRHTPCTHDAYIVPKLTFPHKGENTKILHGFSTDKLAAAHKGSFRAMKIAFSSFL